MPGPKARLPAEPALNQLIVDILDGFAFAAVNMRLGILSGMLTEHRGMQALQECFDTIISAAQATLPPNKKGRPKDLDKVLRRLMVRKHLMVRAQLPSGALTQAFETVGQTVIKIQEPNGQITRSSGPINHFDKHYHRDRKREAMTDAYMAFFEAALRKYHQELTGQ